MKQRPDFPAVWDNSMRKVFKLCPKKFEYEFIKRYRPARFSQHLQGGMAFAHGMEVARKAFYQEGLTHEDAVVKGWLTVASDYSTYESLESDVKTAAAMTSALAYYFSVWRMDQDFVIPYNFGNGNLGLEFSFALPLDVLHPVTGQPLLYYGRMDMLGERENGTVWIVDEKTASRLGTSWVEGWALDSQFTGYCWAVREYGLKVHGAIIRGVSILSSGHGHAQSLQPRPDWMVQRWKEQLERDIKKAILMWDDGFLTTIWPTAASPTAAARLKMYASLTSPAIFCRPILSSRSTHRGTCLRHPNSLPLRPRRKSCNPSRPCHTSER